MVLLEGAPLFLFSIVENFALFSDWVAMIASSGERFAPWRHRAAIAVWTDNDELLLI
jgi:hypothetical protein